MPDSAAHTAYLSRYGVRDTVWSTPFCTGYGYLATPPDVRAMGLDPEIRYLQSATQTFILAARPGWRDPGKPSFRDFRDPYRNRRLDGRALPTPRPLRP
jgi:hypothetical protein